MKQILINGRFAAQNLSGVQRFATEVTRALARLAPERVSVLAPPGAVTGAAADLPGLRAVGRGGGQAWEQLQLPCFAKQGLLVNLGNTAPLLARRQLIVIHDTGVFDTPEAYSWKFRAWYRLMQKAVVRRGAILVTISEFSREQIARNFAIDPARIHVMGEGADHMDRLGTDDTVLERHELQRHEFVLAAGNLAAHKNLAALGALAEALAVREIPLVITGASGGAAFNAAGAGLPQTARYIGRVSDAALKSLYQAAGCFVFPSRYEGFGLPPIEAMACGCPVVAGAIPPVIEACRDAVLYASPARPEQLAAQVLWLMGDPARRASLGELGRARAKKHRWDEAAAQLLAIIDSDGGI